MKFDFQQQPGMKYMGKYSPDPTLALVSIVTPFYNAGAYFEQTFNSVMNQTFPWFEWIIVNDGSTVEKDVETLYFLADKDKRIRVVNQENKGLSGARNTGFDNAKTDIVIPLDADDLISPQYVEYLFFGMYYHPEAAWCYTNSLGFGAEEYLWKHAWDAEKLKTYNFLISSAAIRKKDAEEIGGYKVEKWSYNEDWRFWLEMLSAGKMPVHVGGYLFWYRRLGSSMLSDIRKNSEKIEFSNNIISEAAAKADGTIKAIEYPLVKSGYPYYKPHIFQWDSRRKTNPTHDKINLLFVIPWMVTGGADKFNLDLVRGLDKERFHISILTTEPSENEWQQRFEKYTDEVFNLPDFLDPAHYVEFISYYIQSRDIDVLFLSNSYVGYYMLPWLKKEFPELAIADYVHMEEWYWREGGYARLSGMFGNLLDKTYVCNSATLNVMIKDFTRVPESVETLYIGVNHEEFDRTKVKPGYLYNLLKIEKTRPIVLFPCRIHPQKRPFMMLEIAEKVAKERPDILFVVVGEGEQLSVLKQAIRERGLENTVYSIGRSECMKECYRDATLTLICSLKEGLALTAYESCAMGVPVISSDVGGQRDLIDNSVGRLIPMQQHESTDFDARSFDKKEIAEYVRAIIELCSDTVLYNQCSANCRKKIVDRFSVSKMTERFEEEFQSIISDEHLKEKRKEQSDNLKELGYLSEELLTIKNVGDIWELDSNVIWAARCYFERELAEAQSKLNSIYSMRTWKLTQKYRDFMVDTKAGKKVRGVMVKIYHLFRKN